MASTQVENVTSPRTSSSINNMGRIRYDKKAESEFFVDNSALAGFTGERILYMAVRELIENSLDSCEIHHILPDITLSLKLVDPLNDLWLISCEDNGIGIPMTKCLLRCAHFLHPGNMSKNNREVLASVSR